MVAFAAMIGVPLAFSSIVKLGFDEQTAVISGVLVAGGVVTMIQSLGIGPIGARLPLVNDATFKFLGPLTLAYKFGGFSSNPAIAGNGLTYYRAGPCSRSISRGISLRKSTFVSY